MLWVQVLVGAGLLVGPLLVLSLYGRARFALRPGSFRCRVATVPSRWAVVRWAGRGRRWHHLTRARWAGDVLLLRSGPLGLGVRALAVRVPPAGVTRRVSQWEARRLGRRPVALRLVTVEGRPLDVVAADDHRDDLVGPYVLAGLVADHRGPRQRET